MIQKIPSHQFYWSRWRAGSYIDLGMPARTWAITSEEGKAIIRKHAVGWCRGEDLSVRPKKGEIAVMYFMDDRHWWSHMYGEEFKEVFPDVSKNML